MRQNSNIETKKKTGIRCLEVLISRSNIEKSSDNLFWTLSVYSLENQPVQKNRDLHDSEIFHFMVYDWNRTLRNLLEQHRVPFSIIQFFNTDSILFDKSDTDYPTPDNEAAFLHAVERMPQRIVDFASKQNADLTLEGNLG